MVLGPPVSSFPGLLMMICSAEDGDTGIVLARLRLGEDVGAPLARRAPWILLTRFVSGLPDFRSPAKSLINF